MSAYPSSDAGDAMALAYGLPPAAYGDAAATMTPGTGKQLQSTSSTPYGTAVYASSTPSTIPVAPVVAGGTGRNLVYVGVRNLVLCRDITRKDSEGKSSEIWRHEMGSISRSHRSQTFIVYTSNTVVAQFLKSVKGLDPISGAERWTYELSDYGVHDVTVIAVNGPTVYIGFRDKVAALSVTNGQLLWEFQFSHKFHATLPVIACCGMNVFVAAYHEVAFLNAADGTIRWRLDCSMGEISTAAWDGENHVLIGRIGYLHPIDLRTGTMGEKINLKGTGLNPVCLTYDMNKRAFYAVCYGSLFAISGGDENKILWRCDFSHFYFTGLGLDSNLNRIYVFNGKMLHCVDTSGNNLFSKSIPVPATFFSVGEAAITLDLQGCGRILIGGKGYIHMLDGEGNVVETENYKEVRYDQIFMCTSTASVDENASGDEFHNLIIRNR